jgi:hypothetical protein
LNALGRQNPQTVSARAILDGKPDPRRSLREVIESDHVIDQASDLVDEPIARFLVVIAPGASLKAADLMQRAWRAGGW